MISIQRLTEFPLGLASQLTPAMTKAQLGRLQRDTTVSFLVYRGDIVICLFGLTDPVFLSSYQGLWFGLLGERAMTLGELRLLNVTLDCLSRHYQTSLRAMVARGNKIHNAFARFCKFTPYGENANYISYERGVI